jgi:histone deacetylase 11
MIVFYNPAFNIDLGLLNRLHPFDGRKFRKVAEAAIGAGIEIRDVGGPVEKAELDRFAGEVLRDLYWNKRYVLGALEVPYLPLVPFSLIDKRVLLPMRWGVGGTMAAARHALSGVNCWNLSGGYHHASRNAAEGFCIYNDIGIAVDRLRTDGTFAADDRLLLIDIDAHHGNGNGHVFYKDTSVEILDIYDGDIYPNSPSTKRRVDVGIPLRAGTGGDEYLAKLEAGLARLHAGARLAFVVAGTDVLASDPLGGLRLTVDDCVARDRLVLDRLAALGVPAVFTGGGGYGPESAAAMTRSLLAHAGR